MGFFNAGSWASSQAKQPTLAQCGACGLSKTCISPRMSPTGKGLRKILFVAEAPGETEDRKGVQLIGDAGQLLRTILRELGLDLDDCWKTNAVICRPPKNKMENTYVDACRPNLLKTIRELKPNVIILMGEPAVLSLISTDWARDVGPISRWVGWNIPSLQYNAWLCPTFHPSYVKRMNDDIVLRRMVKEHLAAAIKLEKKPVAVRSLKEIQDKVEIILNPRLARLRMRDLSEKEGHLAFDYECTGLKPDLPAHRIVSCSFCLNGHDTFACMIDDKALPVLSRVLLNDRLLKIASNIKFEDRWTRAKLGHPVAGWHWDTMLGAHIQDNRPAICSLKFQAYIKMGVPDYESHTAPFLTSSKNLGKNAFNQIHKIHPKDLLLYNGVDSLIEYDLSVIQKREMGL